MKRRNLCVVLVLACAATPAFAGYVLNLVSTLPGPAYGDLLLSGNTFYGTTQTGGANNDGTVFSVPLTGGAPTVLASFNGANGSGPVAGLILSGGTLYGTTQSGEANNDGTVFSVPLAGGVPTVLGSLNGANGSGPMSTLAISGDTLYGTATTGGASGFGTVFSVPVAGGTPTLLTSFSGRATGSEPFAGVTIIGNELYGTTGYGGANGYGVLFSLPLAGGTPTVLSSFVSASGKTPMSGLMLSGNTFYGTAQNGGGGNVGTVYSIPITGGTPTLLGSVGAASGNEPRGGLTLSNNLLYGTTFYGGTSGYGTVFSVPVSGGTPTTLASFANDAGDNPSAGLTLVGSTFYGTTTAGTIFALAPSPAISLTAAPPSAFGNALATLVFGSSTRATFPATASGYVRTSAWSPTTGTEIYALAISDSVPANLAADLAALVTQINNGSYAGYSISASTIDPTNGNLSGAATYNLFLTFSNPTLGVAADYFGFDLSQLNGTSDVLTASSIAVVPEPACAGLAVTMPIGTLLLRRRCRRS